MISENHMQPWEIVQKMMEKDAFSKWLGVEIMEVKRDFAQLRLVVRPEMLNGFGIAHGGIAYSLADSALAFAANTAGRVAVSTQTSMTYIKEVKPHDNLIAIANCIHQGNKIAHYQIEIKNQEDKLVATFNGTVYRSSKMWLKNQ